MSYIEQNLLPGEQIVYRTKLHWVIFISSAFFLFAGIVLIILSKGNREVLGLGGLLFLIGIILGIVRWVAFKSSEFAVTDKRVLIKIGLLQRHSLELLLNKIEGIGVDQPLQGRILGYGTIIVTGTGGTKETFENITDPLEFRKQVQEKIPK
jgi:uncharacterized membrane protein YdbT with pleckstrin-like domain